MSAPIKAQPEPLANAALAAVAAQFPGDLKVAQATALALQGGPAQPSAPAQEPWPPMQVPR